MSVTFVAPPTNDSLKLRIKLGRPDVMMFGLRNIVNAQGGVESHVRHLAEHLSMLGLSVEVIIRSRYSSGGQTLADQQDKLISVKRIWSPRNATYETFVHSLISVLYAVKRRPRLLHIHAVGPGLMTPIARLFGIKVVVTHHGEDYNREKWGRFARFLLKTGEKFVALFAHECIVVSRPLADKLAKRYRRNFEYIPNGVDAPKSGDEVSCEEFGIAKKKYILNVGRIVPEKRQIDLIKAFKMIDRDELNLVFVGAPDHNSDYGRQLEALAKDDRRIRFLGYQQGAKLSSLFANAALFALPSSHEGLPIVVLEAMSHGIPVILSDIQANLAFDLPEHCYTKTGSVEGWYKSLTARLNSNVPAETVEWSQYLRSYRWDDVAAKTVDVYERTWQS